MTTITVVHQRVAMHGVPLELLQQQALAVGLPLWIAPIPSPCHNHEYEGAMNQVIQRARTEGISVMAFGDLFLEDVRRYRETQLAGTGIRPLFPLWGRRTDQLAREMLSTGLRACVTCVDPKQVPGSLAGREFDASLLADLPPHADPCGERGEFHTFAYDGPMFHRPVTARVGQIVERDGFIFADISGRTA